MLQKMRLDIENNLFSRIRIKMWIREKRTLTLLMFENEWETKHVNVPRIPKPFLNKPRTMKQIQWVCISVYQLGYGITTSNIHENFWIFNNPYRTIWNDRVNDNLKTFISTQCHKKILLFILRELIMHLA